MVIWVLNIELLYNEFISPISPYKIEVRFKLYTILVYQYAQGRPATIYLKDKQGKVIYKEKKDMNGDDIECGFVFSDDIKWDTDKVIINICIDNHVWYYNGIIRPSLYYEKR